MLPREGVARHFCQVSPSGPRARVWGGEFGALRFSAIRTAAPLNSRLYHRAIGLLKYVLTSCPLTKTSVLLCVKSV